MEIRKIIAGLILSTLTTLSWSDGHGHNLEDCVKKFADAQVGNWEGSFRFWNQAVNQVVDMEFKNSITKTGDDKLKFAMTSAAGNATTEQPIASEWSGSPNWIKESSTTYKVTSCNVTDACYICSDTPLAATGAASELRTRARDAESPTWSDPDSQRHLLSRGKVTAGAATPYST